MKAAIFDVEARTLMKILVANLGSTSFKYRLFDMADEKQLARGGPKACLRLRDIIGYAFLRCEGGVPRHALEFDRGDAELFLKF